MAANSGLDAVGAYRERLLQSTFVLRSYRTMKPRNRAHSSAKPQSARGPLDAVRRIHKRMGIETVSLSVAVQACEGMLRQYAERHGPEALLPHRKEPFTREIILSFISDDLNGLFIHYSSGIISLGIFRHLIRWAHHEPRGL